MQIKKLSLTNFRNWQERSFDLSPLTVIVGSNGIGKTSIVEAIYLLGTAKSFRTSTDQDLLKDRESFFRVVGEGTSEEGLVHFEVRYNSQEKKNKHTLYNGQEYKYSKYIGKLKVVILSFESNRIISGAPSDRRQFLDSLICQLDSEYTYNLLRLGKILKQRNHLLQSINQGLSQKDELDFWDEELLQVARFVTQSREAVIQGLSSYLKDYFNQLIKKGEAKVLYKPSLTEEVVVNWKSRREKEIILGQTLNGPHRDDLLFLVGEKPISEFCSRGENRSYLYALKKAELEYIAKKTSQSPILLIDDCYSELDEERQERIWEIASGQQTIMTTTSKDHPWPRQDEFGLISLN